MYFAEILIAIESLSKDSSATRTNIENKLNELKDGYEDVRFKRLEYVLNFASEQGYIIKEQHKGKKIRSPFITFKLIHSIEGKICCSCKEFLRPFAAKNYQVGVSYVDKMTFDSLAREVHELKEYILNGRQREDKNTVEALMEENRVLKQDIA